MTVSYGGWIIDTDWQTSYSWLLGFDGGVTSGNGYGFRIDPNLKALQFLKSLYADHCAWLPQEPASFNVFDPFSRRLALFVSADLSQISQAAAAMAGAKKADEWQLLPYPGSQRAVVTAYGPSWTVLKSTPEKQLAAWVFARWLLSPENQAEWVKATGLLPLRTSALDKLAAYKAAFPWWGQAVASLGSAEIVPQMASWRKVKYVLEDGLTTMFMTDTPLARLPALLEELDSTAQEMNK